jgi:hypothetical protein
MLLVTLGTCVFAVTAYWLVGYTRDASHFINYRKIYPISVTIVISASFVGNGLGFFLRNALQRHRPCRPTNKHRHDSFTCPQWSFQQTWKHALMDKLDAICLALPIRHPSSHGKPVR